MSIALAVSAIVLGILGMQVYYLPTFIVRLGPGFIYRARWARVAIALASLGAAAGAYARSPSTGMAIVLAVTGGLTLMNGFFHPRRVLPLAVDPPHAAEPSAVGDEAMVLGLALPDGAAAAWPLSMIIPHHLIVDRVGGRRVVATWCHACRSGMVYAAQIDGVDLTFEVASVWRRNMLIRDLQTKSIWQQATGECVAGPWKGRSLELLGGELCTWGAWRRENPRSQVSIEPEPWTGLLPRPFIAKMLDGATARPFAPGLSPADDRLAKNADVAGVTVRGEVRAYPVELLRARGRVIDRLGGEVVSVAYEAAGNHVRAWRGDAAAPPSREALLAVDRQFWVGFREFHPGTGVYGAAA